MALKEYKPGTTFPGVIGLTTDQSSPAWRERRNQPQRTISWRFITADARIKLKRLYPSIET